MATGSPPLHRGPKFNWPPRKPDADAEAPSPTPAQTLAPLPPVRPSAWSRFEETWLDVVSPPLSRRLAAINWSPDDPSAYCHRCGATVGPYETDRTGCSSCRDRRIPWTRLVRLGDFEHPLRSLVHEVKFTHWRRLGRDLGRLLGRSVAAAIEQARADPSRWKALPVGPPVIVPVPMSLPRRLFRGIDHTHEIAVGVAEAAGGRVVHALRRSHGPSQLAVPQSERAANVARSIHPRLIPRPGPLLAGRLVIVVDDVTTTGATMRAACRAAKAACKVLGPGAAPEVWAGVVAKTPRTTGDGRRRI